MNVGRAFDILDNTLGMNDCEGCEVKEGCKVLKENFNIDFCRAFDITQTGKINNKEEN